MSVLILLLLAMTFLATATMSLAQRQFTWARLGRQTSNSYQLARSGAEKTVDSMNKEIAKVLPSLMEEAAHEAYQILMADGGIQYASPLEEPGPLGQDHYAGNFLASDYDKQYEIQLKKAIYQHIVKEFMPATNARNQDYKASKSDIANPQANLIVDTRMDYDGDKTFLVQVTAQASQAEMGGRSYLSKSIVLASIGLDQEDSKELLIEEYEWADAYPETIQSAVISFGDFLINDQSKAIVEGDIQVKGTGRPVVSLEQAKAGEFPQPDESGGILIANGGKLRVTGNAIAVANIQTTNSPGHNESESEIHIQKDAIASSIAINDHSADTDSPWLSHVKNNKITVGRNVFMDNDLRIDRYVEGGLIQVGNSVFGISDGARLGPGDKGLTYLDPNESSGIYAMGKMDDPKADSSIEIGRVFLAGQAYINFQDGNGYHRLLESAGEPFEDLYDTDHYIQDFRDLINTQKIKINEKCPKSLKPMGYAPGFVSASLLGSEDLYDIGLTQGAGSIKDHEQARRIFYKGIDGAFSLELQDMLTGESDWNEPMAPANKEDEPGYLWASVIDQPYDYYRGSNPFDKDYGIRASMYDQMNGYKGLEAYMLAKRGVFYQGFEKSSGTDCYQPRPRQFNEFVNLGVFDQEHKWERNNSLELISQAHSYNDYQVIDISAYEGQPTAIVSTLDSLPIILRAQGREKTFTGVIITPGKLIIEDDMTINGLVIAGNEYDQSKYGQQGSIRRQDIHQGKYAGIQIRNGARVNFNYDFNDQNHRNIIFTIPFMDKSLERKLYDCLKITNYAAASEDMDVILGANLPELHEDDFVLKPKVRLSQESVISSQQEGLQFTIRSLKKIPN